MVMRKGGHYAQKLLRNNCNYIHHCGLPGAGKYYQYLWREPRSFLAGPGGDCQRDPTCVGIDWRTGLTDLPVEPPCRKSSNSRDRDSHRDFRNHLLTRKARGIISPRHLFGLK